MPEPIIKYSDKEDLAFSLLEHRGISYWSLITPWDITPSRYLNRTIKDVAERKNERAKRLIDSHIDMCKFFGYTQYQGEYRERNGWHFSDRDFFYLNINKWEHGEEYWKNVPIVSREDMERYRKSKKKQLELF